MDATVSSPVQRQDLSAGMTRANNQEYNFSGNQYLMTREPDYWVYIHNVSEQAFTVSRPPIINRMQIVGKEHGKKSVLCARFPQPLIVQIANVDSNEITPNPTDARKFAMDVVNPDNTSLDQDAIITNITAIGNNLGAKGVFWSLNEVPTEAEINAAVKRMEKHYKTLVEKANTVQASKPADLPETLTPETHIAADYLTEHFGEQFKWHTSLSRLESCELCGEKVKAGIAFHRTEEGGVCVRDWVRCVASGARTRAQAYEATGDPKWLPQTPQVPAVAPKNSIPTE